MSEQTQHTIGTSDQTNEAELSLAINQGDANIEAVEHMTANETGGAVTYVGDYLVAYAVGPAQGLYVADDGGLEWREPDEENVHVFVTVCDGATGRFIPSLTVTVTLLDRRGRELGCQEHPFVWHPWLYYYGRNWAVPRDGEYRLRVRVEPPAFLRNDRANGRRFTGPAEVEFEDVVIRAGRQGARDRTAADRTVRVSP